MDMTALPLAYDSDPDHGAAPVLVEPPRLSLVRLADAATDYGRRSLAASTLRTREADWRAFVAWCDVRGADSLPADPRVVCLWLADLAGSGLATGTIARKLSSLRAAHRREGHPVPTTDERVRAVWRGIKREHGVAPRHRKAALRTTDVRAMVAGLSRDRLIDVRDRALVLLGFATACRRSELVGLDVGDVAETDDGLTVTIRRSKTDQEGQGAVVGVPYGSDPATCPVRALRAWLDAYGLVSGPLFVSVDRHGRTAGRRLPAAMVRAVVVARAETAGLDAPQFGAHSLRAGLITEAVLAGVREQRIMEHSRHRSVAVFRTYVREVGLWNDNPAAAVGL
jgi:integrase